PKKKDRRKLFECQELENTVKRIIPILILTQMSQHLMFGYLVKMLDKALSGMNLFLIQFRNYLVKLNKIACVHPYPWSLL
ncbi:MAG: hypothetical protein ACO3PR_14600, partial [Limisphaerales bacterium]